MYPLCGMYQNFIHVYKPSIVPLCAGAMFCLSIHALVHTWVALPFFCYCEQCCCAHCCTSVSVCNGLGFSPKVGLPDHRITPCVHFEGVLICFAQQLHHFTFPKAIHGGSETAQRPHSRCLFSTVLQSSLEDWTCNLSTCPDWDRTSTFLGYRTTLQSTEPKGQALSISNNSHPNSCEEVPHSLPNKRNHALLNTCFPFTSKSLLAPTRPVLEPLDLIILSLASSAPAAWPPNSSRNKSNMSWCTAFNFAIPFPRTISHHYRPGLTFTYAVKCRFSESTSPAPSPCDVSHPLGLHLLPLSHFIFLRIPSLLTPYSMFICSLSLFSAECKFLVGGDFFLFISFLIQSA